MSEDIKKSVKERIILISNEIRIGKSGSNEFTRSNYFQPDEVLRAITPLLHKYNLISIFKMPFNKDKEMYEGSLTIEDFDTPEAVTFTFDIPMQELKSVGRAQMAGATQTYCKRYLFMDAFNLADNKADPDSKNNKPADNKDYKKKLEGAKTLDELQKIWASVPPIVKGELNIFKEELKAKLSK